MKARLDPAAAFAVEEGVMGAVGGGGENEWSMDFIDQHRMDTVYELTEDNRLKPTRTSPASKRPTPKLARQLRKIVRSSI